MNVGFAPTSTTRNRTPQALLWVVVGRRLPDPCHRSTALHAGLASRAARFDHARRRRRDERRSATSCCRPSRSSSCSYFRKLAHRTRSSPGRFSISRCWSFGWAHDQRRTSSSIVTKPDNVPIVMLIFSVGFFTWLGLAARPSSTTTASPRTSRRWKSRRRQGLVWPDLVYTELIVHGHLHVRPGRLGASCSRPRWSSRPPAPRRRTRRRPRGTSSACRKCSSTSTRGWPASCCRP